jgi:hypothetical protein
VSTLLSLAIAPTRAWTALYTRGLPAEVRGERREEIDCDLWEHQRQADLQREPATNTAAAILLRLIMGIPADMTWRLEAGANARSGKGTQMNDSWTMRGLLALALAVAAFPAVIGVLVAIGANGEIDGTSERLFWGISQTIIGTAIISGLVISARRPSLGIGLVAAGTIAISALWYWFAMITVPIGLVLLAIAYFRAGRPSWPRGARPA